MVLLMIISIRSFVYFQHMGGHVQLIHDVGSQGPLDISLLHSGMIIDNILGCVTQ
jgi:hypothetical protein